MTRTGRQWVIVLAAGDGTRLSSITTDIRGITTPKQYCTLARGRSLLQETLGRAERLVPRDRIVVVVAERHETWWREQLADVPWENIVVQPRNRGTAAGVLLPLSFILERDPEARILLLPSDHFVEREEVLARSLRSALGALEKAPDDIVLVGISPEAPETDYGWIVPERDRFAPLRRVSSFVEKPEASLARSLMKEGGAWNSFIIAARGVALERLYEERLPWLIAAFRSAGSDRGALYDAIGPTDFSRDLLQGSERSLRLLMAPSCGWTDLGTPGRVAQCLRRLPARALPRQTRFLRPAGPVDLLAALPAWPM